MSVGENLSTYQNMQTLESKTARGLDDILNSIKMPFTIVSRYYGGGKHFCTITSIRPIKLIKRVKGGK